MALKGTEGNLKGSVPSSALVAPRALLFSSLGVLGFSPTVHWLMAHTSSPDYTTDSGLPACSRYSWPLFVQVKEHKAVVWFQMQTEAWHI